MCSTNAITKYQNRIRRPDPDKYKNAKERPKLREVKENELP